VRRTRRSCAFADKVSASFIKRKLPEDAGAEGENIQWRRTNSIGTHNCKHTAIPIALMELLGQPKKGNGMTDKTTAVELISIGDGNVSLALRPKLNRTSQARIPPRIRYHPNTRNQ
jgi:hypothetical protein